MRKTMIKIVALALVLVMMLGAFGIANAQDEQTLTILYWQAVSILNPNLSGGTKDYDASALILEPLAWINPDGEFVPALAEEIPTIENGGVVHTDDSTTITWTLQEGLVWSDGSPVTAEDVVFTWEYCTDPETGCSNLQWYADVETVEAVDDRTAVVTFGIFKPYPYGPFVGSVAPILNSTQFADCVGAAASSCTEENFGPIGTGPFVVEEMKPNDVVTYVRNENYRFADEGKPFFDRVVFKGGGDAESAARAVLETGEADYAWNLQIAPDVLEEMESAGLGTVVASFGSSVERILINFTNPDPSLDAETRSVWFEDGSNAHPFLSDPVVRQALSMAIDRNTIAEQLYGFGGQATCNIVNGPPAIVSENTSCEQDIDGANALLDEAGIVDTDGDGVREYDGMPLQILYQTSTNAVRQNTQAIIKQNWEQIGVETELRNIDAAVFFGGDPASPDTYQKFYSDVEMFTSSTGSLDPEGFLVRWICGEAPRPSNGWLGRNVPRYCNPEYDALYEELVVTGDPARREELAIAMNDTIVGDYALLPLVFRGSVSAHANSLEGVWINGSWDTEMWNVADWTRAE